MAGFGEQKENTLNSELIKKTGPQLLEKAVKLHKEGQIIKAEKLYVQAIEAGFHHEIIFSNLGVIYKNTNRIIEAKETYKRAILSNPQFADAYANLGSLLKEEGQLDHALAATLKALELKPDHPDALMNLGGIYQDLGQLDHALESTLKSLELKPDSPTAHMNLGMIYIELGQLDRALASTLKSLEIKPNSPDSQLSLGKIYKELGNLDEATACLIEATKSEKTNENASIALSQIYHQMGLSHEAIKVIGKANSKKAHNLLLSLYLCLDDKHEFNRCASDLIGKRWLNPQGVAAIDHANVVYSQALDNGLEDSTMNSIFFQTINEQEFSDALMKRILIYISKRTFQSRSQGLLLNGEQTSGNILDIPEQPFQTLKRLLVQKINSYNQLIDTNTDKAFQANWDKNLYRLRGWAIIMNKGGNLTSHNHEAGWLTGTFYLQMPEEGANTEEGAIEFSHQGPKYPEAASAFERRVIRPNARDLNIFSSSLFHRTLPFKSETQRICIAFDVTRNEKLWEGSN